MKVQIVTKSFTVTSGRGGNTEVDINILHDEIGFPYINGRRLKGLLKEAALNAMSRLKIADKSLVHSIFGTSSKNGKLRCSNAYLAENNLKNYIIAYNTDANNKVKITTAQVLKKYTANISQTTIATQYDNGSIKHTAKDKSLRKFKAILPNITFDWEMDTDNCSERETALLNLACLELRNIGVRRNRGNGYVKFNPKNLDWQRIQQCIDLLKSGDKEIPKNSNVVTDIVSTGETITRRWVFEAIDNLIFPNSGGDPNTIVTSLAIPGNTFRGAVAKKIIDNLQLPKAHENDIFYEMILSEHLRFSYGFPFCENKTFYPLSMQWFYKKGASKNRKYDIFYPSDDQLKFQPCFVNDYEKLPIKTNSVFHISRDAEKERFTGKNIDGEMFYYESVEAGVQYAFEVTGDEAYLDYLSQLISVKEIISLGRSKFTEYGRLQCVRIEDVETTTATEENEEEESKSTPKQMVITCQSPLVVFNAYGKAAPDIKTLSDYLPEGVQILKAVFQTTSIMMMNRQWMAGGIECHAFDVGSAFLVKIGEEEIPSFLGEWNHIGCGQVSVIEYKENEYFEFQNYNKEKPLADDSRIIDFITDAKKEHLTKEIKRQAMLDAYMFNGNPSGSICKTMILAFEQFNSKQEVEKFVNARKQIAQFLKDKALKLENITFSSIISSEKHLLSNWEQMKIYWKNYFHYLHKKTR